MSAHGFYVLSLSLVENILNAVCFNTQKYWQYAKLDTLKCICLALLENRDYYTMQNNFSDDDVQILKFQYSEIIDFAH